MKKLNLDKKTLILFVCLFFIGMFIFCSGYILYGNSVMKIDEYVGEWVVINGTNAILENNMFRSVLLLLLLVVFAFNFFFKSGSEKIKEDTKKEDPTIYLLITVNVLIGIYAGGIRPELILVFLTVGTVYSLISKEDVTQNVIKYSLYSVFACFVAYLFAEKQVDTRQVMIFTGVLYFVFYFFFRNKDQNRLFKVFQCVYPLVLILYLKNQYEYHGEILRVNHPLQVRVFFYLLISVLIIWNIFYVKKEWNNKDFSVSIATCISTAIIFGYTETGRFVQDVHHLGEDVISFNQIFLHHKIPYINSFPVSGAFPVAIGFIENIFGMGLNGANMAISIFNISVCVAVVLLLSRYLDNKQILCLTLMFPLANSYIRANLILVYILILFLPELKNKSGYWLESFVICSYIIVFFYPVFGAACVFGVLPLALINLYRFFIKKEYKTYFKEKSFCIVLICEIIFAILLLPATVGLIKHILLYSDKSILCNASPTFGQEVSPLLLPYLPESAEYLRRALWYGIRYMIPIIIIVFLFYILIKISANKDESSYVEKYLNGGKWGIAGMFILIVCCTLTMKRQDEYDLLSRTGKIIFPAVAVIIYILFSKCIKKNITSSICMALLFFVYMINVNIFPSIVSSYFVKVREQKDIYIYAAEGEYAYISKEESKNFPNLGEGFIPGVMKKDLEKFARTSKEFLEYDKELSFFGMDLSSYEALRLRAWEQPSTVAIMSYKTSKHELDKMKKTRPVIYDDQIFIEKNHNIYKFLLTDDSYVYDEKRGAFIPVYLADKMGLKAGDKRNSFKELTKVEGVETLGKSFGFLKKNYMETDVGTKVIEDTSEINVEFDRVLSGKESDYIYLELEREGKNKSSFDNMDNKLLKYFTKEAINEDCSVEVSWEGESGRQNHLNCKMSDGRLFIPLGLNINWLLNEHKGFKIKVSGGDEGEKFRLKNLEIMKSKDL